MEFRNAPGTGTGSASGGGPASPDARNVDDVANSDVYEERFRVDRRKLEAMIAHGETGTGRRPDVPSATKRRIAKVSGDEFFQRIMGETGTAITWPCKLKIGAKSRKDPHVKVRGAPAHVARARELIVAVLDTKSNRVALKMDVPHTEHSHVIGKGGANIRTIMEATSCHIHFPDCSGGDRRAAMHSEKSSQVSITGQPDHVEVARKRIRDTLPLVLSFELPPGTNPDSTTPVIQEILTAHSVSLSFRAHSRSAEMFCQVRGCQYQEPGVISAAEKLWDMWRSQSVNRPAQGHFAPTLRVMSTMDVTQQHHSVLRGRGGVNHRYVENEAGVCISFPPTTGLSSSIVLRGPPKGVCLARRLLADYLPLVLMFDIPEEKGMSGVALSSRSESLADQWDIHASITPKSKQLAYAMKLRGTEGKVANLYRVRLALLQNEQIPPSPPTLPPWPKLSDSQLLQDLRQQQQEEAAGSGENPIDLRPHARSLSLSWPSQQAQMENSNRANQPAAAELSQYQFHRSFNEDIFGRTEKGDRLQLGNTSSLSLKTAEELSDSFGHSSGDAREKPSTVTSIGAPLGIHSPQRFSPRQSPFPSPSRPVKKSSGPSQPAQMSSIMGEAMTRVPQSASPPKVAMVKSSSVDSQLSMNTLPLLPAQLQPMKLEAVFDRGTSEYGSATSTAEQSSFSNSTHASPVKTGSLDDHTVDGRASEYEIKRHQAAKAIEQGRKPTSEVIRTPTDFWTGHGFSKSSPEHVLREQLAQQQRYNPSMATMFETEEGMSTVSERIQMLSDDLLGSVPVPLESAVQNAHFAPTTAHSQTSAVSGSAGRTLFGSVGDSPSKKRPANKSDLNWSLWQNWHRASETEGSGGLPPLDTMAMAGSSTLGKVQDLAGLLALLDLSKYQIVFDEQEVDLPIFLTLSEADLKDIGIGTFGARRRMILAINELRQVYQQQMERRTTCHAPSQQRPSTSHQQHTAGGHLVQQSALPGHMMGMPPPHTNSSGTSGSGASISAPSSDCSNSGGSGGILQDLLHSSGHLQLSSTNGAAMETAPTALAASGGHGAFDSIPSPPSSTHSQGKKRFPMSHSTHW